MVRRGFYSDRKLHLLDFPMFFADIKRKIVKTHILLQDEHILK